MHRIILLISLFHLLLASPNQSANLFVAPFGDDTNSGLTPDRPKARLQTTTKYLAPGDTLFLLPGEYRGTQNFYDLHGAPEQKIVIKSYATHPDSFAVINGGASPGSNKNQHGLYLRRVSWLKFVNLKFVNCWTDVIIILQGNYLSFCGCSFAGGRRVIFPQGTGCHHFLVENCHWNQDSLSWTTYDWEEMHHGSLAHLNGALFHPEGTSGGYVVRGNVIQNAFNGFRTRASALHEDGNGEIYENDFINLADNAFEPEGWAFNLHFYHNRLHNIHKAFSIDDVRGGPLYIYGNTITESRDANALEKVSGIWKFKNGPLTEPCYAFNNSFFTEARAFKSGEATNQQMKHFNNAYYFFSGSNRFELTDWHDSFEFDYDCANQAWPLNIGNHQQEAHGIVADARFVDGDAGDLRLLPDSPCIDAGKIMTLPEFDWQQTFEGIAPDIGAFEGDLPVAGPPFRFRQAGTRPFLSEKPRIVRHQIDGRKIILFFSAELNPATVDPAQIFYWADEKKSAFQAIESGDNYFTLILNAPAELNSANLALEFQKWPVGVNGEVATGWASTIPIFQARPSNRVVAARTATSEDRRLSVFPNPANAIVKIQIPGKLPADDFSLEIYNVLGQPVLRQKPSATRLKSGVFVDLTHFASGIYRIRLLAGDSIFKGTFVLMK